MGKCPLCDALGSNATDGCKFCGECDGTGKVLHWPYRLLPPSPDEPPDQPEGEEDCPHCKGTGYCPNYPPWPPVDDQWPIKS